MNILIMGPQASGKGTQAKLLAKKLNLSYFEAGDILRKIAEEKTVLGQRINRTINLKGSLVSDGVMKEIVDQWLRQIDPAKGFIFDGFPRNLSQYRLLEKLLADKNLKIDKAIYLKVKRQTSLKRLSARRICSKCNREYNLLTKIPKKNELCDYCRVELIQRQDDQPEQIKKRLSVYQQLTHPLIEFIRMQGILLEIDGERSIKEIFQDILAQLERIKAQ